MRPDGRALKRRMLLNLKVSLRRTALGRRMHILPEGKSGGMDEGKSFKVFFFRSEGTRKERWQSMATLWNFDKWAQAQEVWYTDIHCFLDSDDLRTQST